ncbi:MAG: hypothetical protein EKK54_01870 [Neisseriaceae bacterium]|nr:MAG: hypothetical protein EKK54_01870 [Neisseriaceae bacterium]
MNKLKINKVALLGFVISAMSSTTFAIQIGKEGSASYSTPNFLTVDKQLVNISNMSLSLSNSGRLKLDKYYGDNNNTFAIDKFKSNENTYLNPITLNVCPNQPINLVVYNSRDYLHMDFSSEQAGYVIKSQTVNNNDASELYVDCKQNGSYYVRLDNGGSDPSTTSASLHVSRVDGLPGSLSYVSKLDTTYQNVGMSESSSNSGLYVYHDKGVTRYDLNNGQLSNPNEFISDNSCPNTEVGIIVGGKITSDHKYLYSYCDESGISGIMASGINEDGSIKNKHFSPVGYVGAYAVTPNGTYLYSTPTQGIRYYKIIPGGILSYKGLTADPNFSYGVVITPDSKHLYYSNYDVDGNQWINYYIINSDGSLTYVSHQRIDCDQRTRVFAISHSGKYMYIADWSGINFYDINSDGSLTKFGQIVVGKIDNMIISNDDKYVYASINGIIYTYKVYGVDADLVSNNKPTPSARSSLPKSLSTKPISQSAILPWGSSSSPNMLQKFKSFTSKWLNSK